MKSILLCVFSFFIVSVTTGQEVLFVEDFEGYENNQAIGLQSPNITTWTNSPGTSEDAPVTQDQALSGVQSIVIDAPTGMGPVDLILPFEDYTDGFFELEFNMYVPTGVAGYFNMQKTSTPAVEWAFEVYISNEGWHIVGGDTIFFDFPNDQWNKFNIEVDLDDVTAKIYLNDTELAIWAWDQTPMGTTGLNQVGGLNLFGGAPDGFAALYYIDDITATYTAPGTVDVVEDAIDETISVYPNPTTGQFTVELETSVDASVSVFNTAGLQMINKNIEGNLLTIDVADFLPGVYFVRVMNDGKLSTKKLIIQ